MPGQAPPAPETGTGKVAWFWVTLGLLLLAAVIAVAAVLISESGDDEMTGGPLVTITYTELKENLR